MALMQKLDLVNSGFPPTFLPPELPSNFKR